MEPTNNPELPETYTVTFSSYNFGPYGTGYVNLAPPRPAMFSASRTAKTTEAFLISGIPTNLTAYVANDRLYVYYGYSPKLLFTVSGTTVVGLNEFNNLHKSLKALAKREGLTFKAFNTVRRPQDGERVAYWQWNNAPEPDDSLLVKKTKLLTGEEPPEPDTCNDCGDYIDDCTCDDDVEVG